MLGRVFGKKNTAPAKPASMPRPTPDADGVTRAIPKAIWDGPEGDFLRKLGMSPDDPSNVMPTRESVQATFDAKRREQDQFVARINAQLPVGAKVIPHAMLPWSLWSETHADFLLVVCGLYAVDPWNTMLLPEDKKSAFILGLPEHPRAYPQGLSEAASRVIGEIRQEHQKVHQQTSTTLQQGRTEGLRDLTEASQKAAAKVVGLAHYLGSTSFGDAAFARHRELFGRALGWAA